MQSGYHHSALVNKRLIFTVTSGRSGTKYLTHVLSGLPGIVAEHEPVPGFHECLPQARHDPALAREFLVEKKFPYINTFSQHTYFEASHYFCKGFIDPLLELGIVPDLILLRRNPRKVASSWFLLGNAVNVTRKLAHGEFHEHILGPNEPNFLPAKGWERWHEYQLCYWYALEAHFRARHYAELITSHGGRTFETFLQPLISGGNYERLLSWMGVSEDVILERVNDSELRQSRVNDQLYRKQRHGRQGELGSLDIDVLEAGVLADCGLSPKQVEDILDGSMAVQPAKKIPQHRPRIFVSIASFRDMECQWTVKNLYAKAAHPERIFVGICWQFDKEEDKACFVEPYPYPDQVRVKNYHYKDAKGAGWARAEAFSLCKDEEYVLAIDSHMRFEPGWDEALIGMLGRLPSKSLLSGYAPRYTPPDNRDPYPGQVPRVCIQRFAEEDNPQMVHQTKLPVPLDDKERGGLYPTPFCIANFMFCRAEVLREVPFDPHIQFWGDEITLSARLWTYGYDIYQPDRVLLYHYWRRDELVEQQPYRRLNTPRSRQIHARIRHLLQLEKTADPAALADIERYALGKERPLASLWAFAGLDWKKRTVTKEAQEGRWNMKARNSLSPGEEGDKLPRIFVQIACYRDVECQWTVKDLFEKAAHPERIFVGICWQFDKKDDVHCFEIPYPRPTQVRVHEMDWRDSPGIGRARELTQTLWRGEEYTLQIDSHMRFVQDWDTRIIEELKACDSPKPVLSCSPPGYAPPDRLDQNPRTTVMHVRPFLPTGGIRVGGNYVRPEPEKPLPGIFIFGCFVFGPSAIITEIPYDPYLYFEQEEVIYSIRLYTHGWDLFSPRRPVLYHYYNDGPKRSDRPLHWDDIGRANREKMNFYLRRAQQRFDHMTGYRISTDPEVIAGLDTYGFGQARTFEQFERLTGIDFKKKTISERAAKGLSHDDFRRHRESLARDKARIFVSIASYRDPECQWTVKDLFEKAAHPERVFVGICWQFDAEADKDCFEIPSPRPEQVRTVMFDWRDGKGVCWARHEVQRLWQGEEYVLQIDAHMRVIPGWDEAMLEELALCDSPKPLITSYPPNYVPGQPLPESSKLNVGAMKPFQDNGNIRGDGPEIEFVPEKPMKGAFVACGFIFAGSDFIREIPYDPHLYFDQEEITLALRLYTKGWDVFSAHRTLIYHQYYNPEKDKRLTHWGDFYKEKANQEKMSFYMQRGTRRFNHMTGFELSDDPEVIAELDKYGFGTVRTLAQFEEFTGIDFKKKTITQKTRDALFIEEVRRWREKRQVQMTATPDQQDAGKTGGKGAIFVNIASYRDPECQWTVKDLFEKAAHPERIFVGICWQFDPAEDAHCFQVSTRPDQVRMLPVDWREAEGVCWARWQTQQLWDGEEYTLMIDSHMRFVPGWDELMIAELAACPSAKPVLSCSPAMYTPPDRLEPNPKPTIRRARSFMPDGNMRCQGESLDRSPEVPLRGALIVANFVFSRSEIIAEVPYDPYLYFDQEEISYAARLYTHGWDVFSARRQFLYHYYNTPESVRPLHWRDLHKEDSARIRHLRERGLKRFNHMTGHRISDDPEVTRELDRYGFGTVRPLEQFEQFTGIDFKRKIASEKALRGLFIENLGKYRDRPVRVPELDDPKPQGGMQAAAGSTALEAGDFMPFFEIADTEGHLRNLEIYSGKPCMLFFLSANNSDYLRVLLEQLNRQAQNGRLNAWHLFVLDGTPDKLKALRESIRTPHAFWADPERRLAKSIGVCRPGDTTIPPTGYLLNRNMKILRRHSAMDAGTLAAAMADDCRREMERSALVNRERRVITEIPPLLIVPNSLSPELCRKCIESFRTGRTFEGTVGAEDKVAYRPENKIRTDHVIGGPLLDEIDDKLSRSLFPEIKKVFGFEVAHREMYKVGMYSGEKGGFFKQHRDNFEVPLAYRRIAMTLHLNDDFEGGGLSFPEYDENTYRPAVGSAIAFPCGLTHEARPVTRGDRYILVGFFHSDEDEAFRRYYVAQKNKPLNAKDHTPTRLRRHPDIRQSRQIVDEWHKKYVRFDGQGEK